MGMELYRAQRTEACGRTHEFSPDVARRTEAFHRSLPGYAPTPLCALDALAARIGVRGLYIKDESRRFGLNAFKALGGSYCIARLLAARAGLDTQAITYDDLMREDVRRKLGKMTFITATDGNHGRGVAWAAKTFGHRSVVYMPKGSAQERLLNIRAQGALAQITDLNYDDTVRFVRAQALAHGYSVIQDTGDDADSRTVLHIMQGYTTMALEAVRQLEDVRPTHVFLQAGVGSMAAAVAAFLVEYYGKDAPRIIIVEPTQADCLLRTARAHDGRLHKVGGAMPTIMAGLACGEPCALAWALLASCAQDYMAITDDVAARGMRVLGNPLTGDPRIISGESGASTMGALMELMLAKNETARHALGLCADARVLLISTEGDTDRENYRRIVWDGLYPNA